MVRHKLNKVKSNKNNQCLLPEKVIQDILLRLPVKFLTQLKCVSKKWCSLIRNPNFIREHFNHKDNQACLLIHRHDPELRRHISTLFLDEDLLMCEDPDHLQLPNCIEMLVGPLNGVFGILNVDLERVALWNPAIREFSRLPIANANLPSYMKIVYCDLSLGLDPLTNEFKVVSIKKLGDKETFQSYHPLVIAVYSSNNDSWRCFEDVVLLNSSMNVCGSKSNNYSKGFCYWMTIDSKKKCSILAFDFGIEALKKIEIPNCIQPELVELALYDDSVAMISYKHDVEKSMDIWVMKEEGNWTRDWTIGPIINEHLFCGFWKKNPIFINYMSLQMIVDDGGDCEIPNLNIQDHQFGFSVCTYKESLASVKRGNQCDGWNDHAIIFEEFFQELPRIEEEDQDLSFLPVLVN
ncbi:hypothetical protein ACH5RR_007047 [Cinchona calisaya]|uniref:F-box domain-containing protein n=1 Tax=Cinchona calisaya TaxID=153742 RepID=A0ABD3AR34_9GENT